MLHECFELNTTLLCQEPSGDVKESLLKAILILCKTNKLKPITAHFKEVYLGNLSQVL